MIKVFVPIIHWYQNIQISDTEDVLSLSCSAQKIRNHDEKMDVFAGSSRFKMDQY